MRRFECDSGMDGKPVQLFQCRCDMLSGTEMQMEAQEGFHGPCERGRGWQCGGVRCLRCGRSRGRAPVHGGSGSKAPEAERFLEFKPQQVTQRKAPPCRP